MNTDTFRVDTLPEGTHGRHEVVRQKLDDLGRLRCVINGHGITDLPVTKLVRYRTEEREGMTTLVMSDTPDEIQDHVGFIARARGRVLIHGLGIGMCVRAVLRKEEVEHVDVVEMSADVIALVAPWLYQEFGTERLTIHCGDCLDFKWPTGTRWSAVWHDIWDTICTDNIPQMGTLHRKFGQRCDWQGSWSKEVCLWHRRRENANPWGW